MDNEVKVELLRLYQLAVEQDEVKQRILVDKYGVIYNVDEADFGKN